jgi:3-methyl-2-oxobutanoate hydroxymethyltransferase
VFHDFLGYTPAPALKHVKQYADLNTIISHATGQYVQDVQRGTFPAEEHSFQ